MKKQINNSSLRLNKFKVASIKKSIKTKFIGGMDDSTTIELPSKNCKSRYRDARTFCIKDKGIEK